MATIKEVADQARVSVATVSRVINKTGYVSLDLQERVVEAMRALNYQPSALARGLRRQETQTIGVLLPQLNQPFFGTLAFAIEKTLFAVEYRVFMCSSEENQDKEDAYVDMLLRQRVDGVVMVPIGKSAASVNRLIEHRVPVVLVDRDLHGVHLSRVMADNENGGYQAVRHLAELGHRYIGVIGGPSQSSGNRGRMAGARRAASDFGAVLDEVLIEDMISNNGVAVAEAIQLLSRSPRPTAVFALSDLMAVGMMHAAHHLGLDIPGDLSVIGFDDIVAPYMLPALTTVAQPVYQMGEYAARLLLRHVTEPDTRIESFVIETRLNVRGTTAPPRV